MSSARKVLIVGGGVGGMSTAISLRQAGIEAELVELDPQWRALGAGLTVNGATMLAFRRLGVLDEVLERGFGAAGTGKLFDVDGNLLEDSNRAPFFGPGVPVAGGILRPVLHQILQQAIMASGATVRLGVGLASLVQHGHRVSASFTDGSTAEYDLVLGADGLFSTVRGLIRPGAKPEFTGQGCWRALVDRPPGIDTALVFHGPRHKVGFNPVSRDQMYLFLLQHAPENPWISQDQWPRLLKEQMTEFGGLAGEIRDALGPDSQINYRPLESILLPPPWHEGRVLLIGDAAHATTPHAAYGAGLAIEDGVVLGDLLALGLEVDEMLRRFMERRYERCRAIVEGSRAQGELEMAHAPQAEQRANFMGLLQVVRAPM